MIRLIIIFIILIGILFWIGSTYGQEKLTDGKLRLELEESTVNFHYFWDTKTTASVSLTPENKQTTCRACIETGNMQNSICQQACDYCTFDDQGY